MVHVPIRGLFFLTRAAVLVAAIAAAPAILRKFKPVAEKIGDTLIKAGEQLKESADNPQPARAANPPANPEPAAKPAPAKKARKKPAAKKRAVPQARGT